MEYAEGEDVANQPKSVDDLMSAQFETILVDDAQGVRLLVPALGLCARGCDAGTAMEELLRRKREYFETMLAAGRADAIPASAGAGGRLVAWPLALFTAKCAIAALALVVAVHSALTVAQSRLRPLERELRMAGQAFFKGMDEGARGVTEPQTEGQKQTANKIEDALTRLIITIARAQASAVQAENGAKPGTAR